MTSTTNERPKRKVPQTHVSGPPEAAELSLRLLTKWKEKRGKPERGPKAPRTMVAETFRIPASAAERLWGAFPELLLGWSEAGFDQRSWLEFYPSELLRDQHAFDGVLLCHTLSPTWDSAALLAELGRCLRISAGLRLPLRVMLASTTWARFNWVAMDLDMAPNLAVNYEWRHSLYDKLGIEVDDCEVTNVQADRSFSSIEIVAQEYTQLAQGLWGEQATNRRLSADEIEACLGATELRNQRSPNVDLLRLSLIRRTLDPQIAVLRTVLRNLHRLDRETFVYFFLQYFHQSRYARHLKVAVRRERDFDEPFRNLGDALETGPLYEDQASVYFSDYYFAQEASEGQPYLTVHPYYFPSGSLYARYPRPSEARARCLMLDDTDASKIQTCLEAMKPIDRARFVSDLLSYAHFLGVTEKKVIGAVGQWMKNRSKSFERSWRMYAVDAARFASLLDEWSVLVFSALVSSEFLPYHFLPYVWQTAGTTTEHEAALIRIILSHTKRIAPLPQLMVEPE